MVVTNSHFQTCYISCACNPVPHVVDWSSDGLICYGTSNVVILYKPQGKGEGGQIVATLSGHKERVNCIRWVKNNDYTNKEIVSGSSDKTAIIWSPDDKGNYLKTSVLTGHENVVTIVEALYRKLNETLQLVIVTASVDSTVRIWCRFNEDAVTCLQVLSIPSNGLCLSVGITTFNDADQNIVIACGYDDSKITIYSQSADDNLFVKQAVLSGHEDWIRALDFAQNDEGEIILASASQDSTVRLWRFMSPNGSFKDNDILQQEKQIIQIGSKKVAGVLEGVLAGHEGWIYGLCWHPPIITGNGERRQPMELLTSSLDKTLAIWTPEEQSGVWLESARMGEIGGNGLGFYGACYGPKGNTLLVHGFNGGIHIWKRKEDLWEPGISITGHFNGVVDLAWEALYGRYLLSVSLDQTTRLHASWLQNKGSWHEMARPQVHGYDMSCIASLPNFSFVSGAEEKVIRAFSATKNFLENFEKLCCVKTDFHEQGLIKNALGAAVPALGLSNRAVYNIQNQKPEDDKLSREQYSEAYFVPQDLKAPPTEDNLGQNTLWPEVMKLYGHGYEVYSLAASHDGCIVASACKATSVEHAAIILWETSKWQKFQTLACHQLTVTQLSFSPDDSHLLAVSRDRCWSLFEKTENADKMFAYNLLAKSDKKTAVHSRIIWTCAWTHTGHYFATGSRDGKVVLWETVSKKPCQPLELPGSSVTALSFAPTFVSQDNEYLVSVGLESGEIILYGCSPLTENIWRLWYKIDRNFGHTMTVKKLAFRPVLGRAGEINSDQKYCVLQLASCGLDHIVKVFDIFLNYTVNEDDVR